MSESSKSEKTPKKKFGFNAGWILVSGLILLCLAGTGLTWWNYSRQVYSSAQGVVLEPQWPESRIAVELPEEEALHIIIGHRARITVGKETKVLQGEVTSIIPKKDGAIVNSMNGASTVIVRLLDEPSQSGHYLPTGETCSVTIDTTVPPLDKALSASSAAPSSSSSPVSIPIAK